MTPRTTDRRSHPSRSPAPLIDAIDSDRFEHYLPDMKAVIEAKTADIDAFMVGMRALNKQAGS